MVDIEEKRRRWRELPAESRVRAFTALFYEGDGHEEAAALLAAEAEVPPKNSYDEAECPGPDCMLCNGEACNKCGAGCWNNRIDRPRCEHDVTERHEGAEPPEVEALEVDGDGDEPHNQHQAPRPPDWMTEQFVGRIWNTIANDKKRGASSLATAGRVAALIESHAPQGTPAPPPVDASERPFAEEELAAINGFIPDMNRLHLSTRIRLLAATRRDAARARQQDSGVDDADAVIVLAPSAGDSGRFPLPWRVNEFADRDTGHPCCSVVSSDGACVAEWMAYLDKSLAARIVAAVNATSPRAPGAPTVCDLCRDANGQHYFDASGEWGRCPTCRAADAPKRTEYEIVTPEGVPWVGRLGVRVCQDEAEAIRIASYDGMSVRPRPRDATLSEQLIDARAEVDRLKLSNDAHRRALGDAPKLLSATIGERDQARAEVERLTADWTKASQESLDAYLKNEALYDLIEGFKNRETRIVEARIKAEYSLAAAILERDRALAFDVTDEQRKRARDAIWRLYLRGSATQDEELDAVLAALCGEGGAG